MTDLHVYIRIYVAYGCIVCIYKPNPRINISINMSHKYMKEYEANKWQYQVLAANSKQC